MTTAVVVLCMYLVWVAGVVMSALGGRWLRSLAPESVAVALVAVVIFVAGLCWPFVVLGCRVRREGHGAPGCWAGTSAKAGGRVNN